jgi:hypothetical protein
MEMPEALESTDREPADREPPLPNDRFPVPLPAEPRAPPPKEEDPPVRALPPPNECH